MAAADAVLLASGTASLGAALLKRPMVVAYRMAALSWFLVSRLVKTEYAGLPNVLAGKALVPELLQGAATPQAMASALKTLLLDHAAATRQLQEFDTMHGNLQQDFARQAADALAQLADTGTEA